MTVYDLGENMSGWPAISVQGPVGSRVQLRPGELVDSTGNVTQHSANASPDNPVLFHYTLRGDAQPEQWHPRFTYYSFRYVEVTVEPAAQGGKDPQVLSLRGEFVHARAEEVGHLLEFRRAVQPHSHAH